MYVPTHHLLKCTVMYTYMYMYTYNVHVHVSNDVCVSYVMSRSNHTLHCNQKESVEQMQLKQEKENVLYTTCTCIDSLPSCIKHYTYKCNNVVGSTPTTSPPPSPPIVLDDALYVGLMYMYMYTQYCSMCTLICMCTFNNSTVACTCASMIDMCLYSLSSTCTYNVYLDTDVLPTSSRGLFCRGFLGA